MRLRVRVSEGAECGDIKTINGPCRKVRFTFRFRCRLGRERQRGKKRQIDEIQRER